MGLVLPNQYYPIVVWEIKTGFLGDIILGATCTPSLSYYVPLFWFMIHVLSIFSFIIQFYPFGLSQNDHTVAEYGDYKVYLTEDFVFFDERFRRIFVCTCILYVNCVVNTVL